MATIETITNEADYAYRQALKVTEIITEATDSEQYVIDILAMTYKLLGLRFNLPSELSLKGHYRNEQRQSL